MSVSPAITTCDDAGVTALGVLGPLVLHGPDGPVRLGVGIAGMSARLEQFGGSLRIRTSRGGTDILAMIPISGARRAPPQARRLRMQWMASPVKADGANPS